MLLNRVFILHIRDIGASVDYAFIFIIVSVTVIIFDRGTSANEDVQVFDFWSLHSNIIRQENRWTMASIGQVRNAMRRDGNGWLLPPKVTITNYSTKLRAKHVLILLLSIPEPAHMHTFDSKNNSIVHALGYDQTYWLLHCRYAFVSFRILYQVWYHYLYDFEHFSSRYFMLLLKDHL